MRFELGVVAVAAVLVVLSAANTTVGEQEKHTLYFVSFLSYPDPRPTFQATWEDAEEIVPSAYLALDQINNCTDILKDYTIRLIESDGGCNIRTRTVVGFGKSNILSSSKQIVGVVGPSCADSSATVVPLTSQNEIALITIHYGSLLQLGDRTKYPYAFGVIDSFDVYAEGILELIKNRMWKRVAILYTDKDVDFHEVYRSTEKWINELPGYEIAFSSVTFETYLPLEEIKESFAPVIVVLAGVEIAKKMLCMAYHEGMVYPTYQWVFMDRYISDFDDTEFSYDGKSYACNAAEMMNIAVNGSISFIPDLRTAKDANITLYRQSHEEYLYNYQEKAKMLNASTTDWANPYYDSIWALALALNASLPDLQKKNLSLTEYGRSRPNITDIIAHHMYSLDFEGISGRIKFEQETGFNNRTLLVNQFINGNEEEAGVYRRSVGKLVLVSQEFVSGEFEPRYDRVAISVAIVFLLLIVITLPPAIMAQIINVSKSEYRTIKASSPRINHIGFVGYYLLALSIVLHTITMTFWLSDGALSALCNIVPWVMNIGLSLMLGTVCLKTWRIYHIFLISSKHRPQLYKHYIHKDYFLALIILLQPPVDILICTLWVVIDPFTSEETQVFQYEKDVPVVVHQKVCSSQLTPYWLVMLAGHKVLIMLSSLFFAILARKVHWKEFETKNVIILVYLLSIACGLGIPLYFSTYILHLNINIPYFLLCTTLAMFLYLCLTLLFLPPLHPLFKERLMHCDVKSK